MRSFRFNSWIFLLVMFLMIAVCFYDAGLIQAKNQKIPTKDLIYQTVPGMEGQFANGEYSQ